jgi:hypothetical protein
LVKLRGGTILTTADGSVWALAAAEIPHDAVEEQVTVEGVVVGFDKLKVDWLGVAQRDGQPRSLSGDPNGSNSIRDHASAISRRRSMNAARL